MKCCINFLSLILMAPGGAYACPFCQSATEAVSAALGRAYSWSVLVMLAVPFLVVTVIATAVVRSIRNETSES